ncbi:MAG: sigma-70 family RNA polymerase sigma factor [Opitutaceae bacterium]|nr:sigma-70 family RNA polymerase sigma factor [Cytophagales bacterium]
MKVTENNIAELIRNGNDKEAIQCLYKNVLPNFKRFVKNNNGPAEDAFDIFQDALIAFYQSVINGKFDPQYKVYGYVYKLCIYRWINKMTREKLQFKDELPDIQMETPVYWFSENSIKDEQVLLKELFSSIGEKCLELLNYTIFKEIQMEDIMLRMNFPSETSVRMQNMRCKEKLVLEIERNPGLLSKLRKL